MVEPAQALYHADGSPIEVIDVDSRRLPIADVWKQQTAIIVFVRHFLCIDCQDYFRDVWSAFRHTDYAQRGVRLVIVGCGTPRLARSLAEDLDAFGHPAFAIYTDPEREAYRALGLVYKTQFECYRALAGAWLALRQGLTKCWCLWNSGDPKQNGGVFVVDKQTGRCLFAHVDQQPNDHAPIDQLLKAAGLHPLGADDSSTAGEVAMASTAATTGEG